MDANAQIADLLGNPLVLLALGWVAAKWRNDQGQHTKAVATDAELLARLKFVETWISDHNTIHGCVQSLKSTTEAIKDNVERIMRLIDGSDPYELHSRLRPRAQRRGYTPNGWSEDDRDDWGVSRSRAHL